MNGSIPTRTLVLLDGAGYETPREADGPRVAHATPAADRPIGPAGRGGDHFPPLSLVPLHEVPDPWEVVVAAADAARNDRVALFVPHGRDRRSVARAVSRILDSPPAVAGEADDGTRTFYTGPDRVHLDGGGLALLGDRDPLIDGDPRFEWFEERRDGTDGDGDDPGRSGSDAKRLVLAVDDDPVAVVDGVDVLDCPGPDPRSFPYSYRREDGVFVVRDRSGGLVGTFAGVRAMRDRGFVPVAAPVVPELEFPEAVSRSWAVLDPDEPVVRTASGDVRLD